MNLREVSPSGLLIPATILGGCLVAIYFGVVAGQADVRTLLIVSLFLCGLLYVGVFYKYTWQLALFIAGLGFTYSPTGFSFSGEELACLLGVALVAVFAWRKIRIPPSPFLSRPSFHLMQNAALAWVAYGVIHFLYSHVDPYSPHDYSIKNALKVYFSHIAPVALLLYLSRRTVGVIATEKFLARMAQITLLVLVINIVLRIYAIAVGVDLYSTELDGPVMQIPLLNAAPGIYALRGLGPGAVLMGMVFITSRGRLPGITWRLSLLLVGLGMLGAILSGGRAAVPLALLYGGLVLIARRRLAFLCAMVPLAIVFVLSANVASNWINTKAPSFINRSMQLVLWERSNTTMAAIENSSDWRIELFQAALREWKSDSRIFWFGRSTYSYGREDEIAAQLTGGEGQLESSLRRGSTHNLITDILIGYGLIGLGIYYCFLLSVFTFLVSLWRSSARHPAIEASSLQGVIGTGIFLIYASIGGGNFGAGSAWGLIVVIAYIRQHMTKEDAEQSVSNRPSLKTPGPERPPMAALRRESR